MKKIQLSFKSVHNIIKTKFLIFLFKKLAFDFKLTIIDIRKIENDITSLLDLSNVMYYTDTILSDLLRHRDFLYTTTLFVNLSYMKKQQNSEKIRQAFEFANQMFLYNVLDIIG